jgi:hypothetical protein
MLGKHKPASATQAVLAVEPVKLTVPVLFGHEVHAAAPVVALKVSTAQAVGVSPLGPVYPASATQAVIVVDRLAPPVFVLTGQGLHDAEPGAAPYVSTGQFCTVTTATEYAGSCTLAQSDVTGLEKASQSSRSARGHSFSPGLKYCVLHPAPPVAMAAWLTVTATLATVASLLASSTRYSVPAWSSNATPVTEAR